MSTLHTVNKSPFERSTLDSCLRVAQPDSAILFIEDGVVGALKNTQASKKVEQARSLCKLYVLGPDLRARGLREDQLIDGMSVIEYDGFVDLAATHDRVQSWL